MKRQNLTEIIAENKHFPFCKCGKRMDWITIRQKDKKPLEFLICPKCNAPELTRVSADGKITNFKLKPDGAFALG